MTKPYIDQAGNGYEVIQRIATFGDFFKLIALFVNQKEMRPYFGFVTRIVMYLLTVPLYLRVIVRKCRPLIVLVQKDGRVIGGLTLSRFGVIENASAISDQQLKKHAVRLVLSAVDSLLETPRLQPVYALTLNRTVARALLHRGFIATGKKRYTVTIMLGPLLTFSWITKTSPTWRLSCMKIEAIEWYILPVSRDLVDEEPPRRLVK